jgi:hypothetical protein
VKIYEAKPEKSRTVFTPGPLPWPQLHAKLTALDTDPDADGAQYLELAKELREAGRVYGVTALKNARRAMKSGLEKSELSPEQRVSELLNMAHIEVEASFYSADKSKLDEAYGYIRQAVQAAQATGTYGPHTSTNMDVIQAVAAFAAQSGDPGAFRSVEGMTDQAIASITDVHLKTTAILTRLQLAIAHTAITREDRTADFDKTRETHEAQLLIVNSDQATILEAAAYANTLALRAQRGRDPELADKAAQYFHDLREAQYNAKEWHFKGIHHLQHAHAIHVTCTLDNDFQYLTHASAVIRDALADPSLADVQEMSKMGPNVYKLLVLPFEIQNDMEALDQAIAVLRQLAGVVPRHHPQAVPISLGLTHALNLKALHTHDPDIRVDIQEICTRQMRDSSVTQEGRSLLFHQLSNSMRSPFTIQPDTEEELATAANAGAKATGGLPKDHPAQMVIKTDLAVSVRLLYQHSKKHDVDLLIEAAKMLHEVLEMKPPPRYIGWVLANLGLCQWHLSIRQKEPGAQETWVRAFRSLKDAHIAHLLNPGGPNDQFAALTLAKFLLSTQNRMPPSDRDDLARQAMSILVDALKELSEGHPLYLMATEMYEQVTRAENSEADA